MENIKRVVNFLFELVGAKTAPRSGWQRIGIKVPESLADHAALSGQIAYILALMEGANPEHSAALALFGDIARIRTGDENWVSRIYSDTKKKEAAAINAQMSGLSFSGQFNGLFAELEEDKSREAVIAKDASFLDMAIQSKYYAANGNKSATLWFEGAENSLGTESAKQIFAAAKETGVEEWWMELDSIKKKF